MWFAITSGTSCLLFPIRTFAPGMAHWAHATLQRAGRNVNVVITFSFPVPYAAMRSLCNFISPCSSVCWPDQGRARVVALCTTLQSFEAYQSRNTSQLVNFCPHSLYLDTPKRGGEKKPDREWPRRLVRPNCCVPSQITACVPAGPFWKAESNISLSKIGRAWKPSTYIHIQMINVVLLVVKHSWMSVWLFFATILKSLSHCRWLRMKMLLLWLRPKIWCISTAFSLQWNYKSSYLWFWN